MIASFLALARYREFNRSPFSNLSDTVPLDGLDLGKKLRSERQASDLQTKAINLLNKA
jgi:hypothetical protein